MYTDDTTSVLTPDQPHPVSPNHRANGQFAKGNKAGPGRPPKAREREILDAINEALPKERVTELINKMIELALTPGKESWRGIEAALSLGLAYQVGKPVQRVANDDGKEAPIDRILREMRAGQPGYDAEGYPLNQE